MNLSAFGVTRRGAGSGGTAAHTYVFSDALVIAPTSGWLRSWPHRNLRDLALDETLTPDAISAAFPGALRLDDALVSRVVLSNGTHVIGAVEVATKGKLGVVIVTIERPGTTPFSFQVPKTKTRGRLHRGSPRGVRAQGHGPPEGGPMTLTDDERDLILAGLFELCDLRRRRRETRAMQGPRCQTWGRRGSDVLRGRAARAATVSRLWEIRPGRAVAGVVSVLFA